MEKKHVNFVHIRGTVKKVYANEKVLKIYVETKKETKGKKEFATNHTVVYFGVLDNIINEDDWVDVEGELGLNSYEGKFTSQIVARKITKIKEEVNESVYDPDNIPF